MTSNFYEEQKTSDCELGKKKQKGKVKQGTVGRTDL